ncbi:DUF21-domain-containing protein [Lichtheimia hyalospora FSU 10163]|nr:DUF21-domain-containing protein [Lichtheimia hyalospora FSU 10163]
MFSIIGSTALRIWLFTLASSSIHVTLAVDDDDTNIDVKSPAFWGQIVAIIALVVCSGIVAGLTLGLMSQDTTNLSILAAAGTPKQRKYAARIMPIRKNGHLVLTTLLLTNTVLNETLPVLFDGLFGKGYIAVVGSTVLIVIFSEILPQAICSRHGLAVGAFFAIPVRVLMLIWFIIAWPIAKLLDLLLGKHQGFMYGVSELAELINLHSKNSDAHGPLEHDTVEMLRNTLELSGKTASDIVDSTRQRYMLHQDTQLDMETMNDILKNGCTAVPVYIDMPDCKKPSIIGVLNTKSLTALNVKDKMPLSKLNLESILYVPSTIPAMGLLRMLQNETSQMAVVYQPCPPSTPSSASCTQEHAESLSSPSASSLSSSQQNDYTFRHHPSSCENGSELPSPDATLGFVTLQDVFAKIMTNPTNDDGTFCGVLVHCPYSESSSIEDGTSPNTAWMSQQRISNRTSSSSTVV